MAKEITNKMERQPTEREKIFASHISNMRLISKIYKELIHSIDSGVFLKGGNLSPLSIPFTAPSTVAEASYLGKFGAMVVDFRTSVPSWTLPGLHTLPSTIYRHVEPGGLQN